MKEYNLIRSVLFCLILAFFGSAVNAQVINSSFESYDPNQVSGTQTLGYLPSPWQQRNSCDFFVQLAGSARTGIASAGFAATANNGNVTNPYREIPIARTTTLTQGVQYKIEFWVKRRDGNTDIHLGAYMSTSAFPCATACSFIPITPHVEGMYLGSNNQYTKIVGTWTAPTTAVYFMHISNFRLTNVEGTELNYFYLDDVSVTACSPSGTPNPQLTLGNAFCQNDPIIADASASANIGCYRWELESQNGTLIKMGEWKIGNPSQLNLNAFATLNKGNCYRLKLVSRNGCTEQNAVSNFCLEDPNVSLTLSGSNPYCSGDVINLTASGDNDWMYTWSTGQSGVGLKTITTNANPSILQYSVTVTTLAGCTATKSSKNLIVHTNNNVVPTTGGVNNTGNFTYYIRANTLGCFNIPTFDSGNESVSFTGVSPFPLPPTATFSSNGAFQETGQFCWIPPTSAIGSHNLKLTIADNNVCGPSSSTVTFTIKVVCEYCPIGIYYENRSPGNNPLQAETEAGQFIIAGTDVDANSTNGPVETGTANVLFQAGEFISLEPGFTGGVNFTALIDDQTCIRNCESCCEEFTGFTHDAIPNVITPNGDGINDFWYVPDADNPFCAFNAQGFELKIVDRWGRTVRNSSYTGSSCCPFVAPSKPNNPQMQHSSIFWDGRRNGGGVVCNGTYFYTLKLKGCGVQESFSGFITVFGSSCRIAPGGVPEEGKETAEETVIGIDKEEVLVLKPSIYPNPTSNSVTVDLIPSNSIIQILTSEGKLLITKESDNSHETIDLSELSTGVYIIRITSNENVYNQKIIKR